MKIHKSPQTIPIYQANKLFETGDLRWLLVLERSQYFDLPEIKDFKDLAKAYNQFISELNNVAGAIESQKEMFDFFRSFSAYLADKSKKNEKAYFRNFGAYAEKIAKEYTNFRYKGKEITDFNQFILDLRKKDGWEVAQFEFIRDVEREPKDRADINEIVAIMRKQGYQIDIFTDTYAYFLSVSDLIKKENARVSEQNRKN